MNRNLQQLRDRRQLPTKSVSQFSLRSLLLVTAAFAIAVLILRQLIENYGTVAAFVVILAGLSIFAHVAGAVIGSRFQVPPSNGDATELQKEDGTVHHQPLAAIETDFAPATELSRQKPLTRKPIYWAVGAGAGACATLASVVLTLVMWENLAIVNVLFGAFSAAIIGGLLGFWVSSFLQVIRSAIADAQKES